jgi:hypothetical protein
VKESVKCKTQQLVQHDSGSIAHSRQIVKTVRETAATTLTGTRRTQCQFAAIVAVSASE